MHLTVRMAWHDNNWDGKICLNPSTNAYCTGAHSLLSGRIEKKKDTAKEEEYKGQYIDGKFNPSNVPPCYWSINAFSATSFSVNHQHAFTHVQHEIPDIVKPYSVFTWPFKLSFVHEKENQNSYGNYPPDLEKRIHNYIHQFKPKESIVFFYANYDNPISADEMKYLLLGCSVIAEQPIIQEFPFSDEELKEFRSTKPMKNFPKINWAFQVTHIPEKAILLPYREYIKYVDKNPEDAKKLEEMKVVIEEESLIQGFKYVSMDIDDDKCLYLLYKIRKSILKVQEHNQLVVSSTMDAELAKVEELIDSIWKKRGIYPSLCKVLNHFIDNESEAEKITTFLTGVLEQKYDLKMLLKDIIGGSIPDAFEDIEDDLLDLAANRVFKKNIGSIATLSLMNLTSYQINKIIKNSSLFQALEKNLYSLYEEYVQDEIDHLDVPQLLDEKIDIYKIDIAMIPDKKYVKRHRSLQNLEEDSKERIRSVIINYLKEIGEQGDCYDHAYNILEAVKEHPLIYKTEAKIDEQSIINLDSDYKSHFIEKLYMKKIEEQRYFYLKNIRAAEEQLKNIIQKLTDDRTDYAEKNNDFNQYIKLSLQALKSTVKTEDHINQFVEERTKLYSNIYKKSFYILTGKPGAGKTYETSQVIAQLDSLGEKVVVLAPTGKAALRITENINKYTHTNIQAETIDRFLFKNKFGWVYDDWDRLDQLSKNEKITVENLIIDESSMLDLKKLKMLFSVIRFDEKYPKRLILVGDENQLPPIGYGKPFHDIITYIINSDTLAEKHYINLQSNCRQENDDTILKLADAFTDKKRGYEEAIEIVEKDGWISKSQGLYVARWKNDDDLFEKINHSVLELFDLEQVDNKLSGQQRLNRLFGLYDNGYVDRQSHNYNYRINLNLEAFQLLTPYRAGAYGTLGLNKLIQKEYRNKPTYSANSSPFYHADKIIRLSNWYTVPKDTRQLKLSNGSIGIINGEYKKRIYIFNDADKVLDDVDDEDNFDLAYAISVHKSQGSDFRNVFLVIPKKRALLSKELIYTALTRSKYRLFLFIEDTDENLLMKAISTSHLLHRNTSVFDDPQDNRIKLIPDVNAKPVRSRIEYIIYQSLQRSGLDFSYEKELSLKDQAFKIHPDFTIQLKNGRTIYWEHLGMLEVKKYYKDWQERLDSYKENGLYDDLITTDDLGGINQERINKIIDDIREERFFTDKNNKFSAHHYELY